MNSDYAALTPDQQQVLALLALGKTVGAAAAEAGIHRNTIANWRRSSAPFSREFHAMHYEQALYWRDEMQAASPMAVRCLVHLLQDSRVAPSVLLRTALAVLDRAIAPLPDLPTPPPADEKALAVPVRPLDPVPAPPELAAPQVPPTPPPAETQNSAQSCTTPTRRLRAVPPPKPLPNQRCPCGSHRKFKNCCLGETMAA